MLKRPNVNNDVSKDPPIYNANLIFACVPRFIFRTQFKEDRPRSNLQLL